MQYREKFGIKVKFIQSFNQNVAKGFDSCFSVNKPQTYNLIIRDREAKIAKCLARLHGHYKSNIVRIKFSF